MWYKVLQNNLIIDVLENPSYVKLERKNRFYILCSQEESTGVLSSDQETVYLFSDYLVMGITQQEYKILQKQLFSSKELKNEQIEQLETIISSDDQPRQFYKYSTSSREEIIQLKNAINQLKTKNQDLILINNALEEKIQQLFSVNENLEDCLIEMSEVVYS